MRVCGGFSFGVFSIVLYSVYVKNWALFQRQKTTRRGRSDKRSRFFSLAVDTASGRFFSHGRKTSSPFPHPFAFSHAAARSPPRCGRPGAWLVRGGGGVAHAAARCGSRCSHCGPSLHPSPSPPPSPSSPPPTGRPAPGSGECAAAVERRKTRADAWGTPELAQAAPARTHTPRWHDKEGGAETHASAPAFNRLDGAMLTLACLLGAGLEGGRRVEGGGGAPCDGRLSQHDSPFTHSASALRAAGNEIIGIDLGTTNSCVAVMEGKVSVQRGGRRGRLASVRKTMRRSHNPPHLHPFPHRPPKSSKTRKAPAPPPPSSRSRTRGSGWWGCRPSVKR